MKRNIAIVTAMLFLFAGFSIAANAADTKARAGTHRVHKHHAKAASAAKPAGAEAKPAATDAK